MTTERHTKAPLPPERAFRRLVRNMRTARDLADVLRACERRRKRDGREFRVVPPAVFDEVTTFLDRMGGAS